MKGVLMPNNSNGNTSNRGFASMDAAKQREIASKGGKSVPPEERSFSKNHALASEAGRKGGQASHGGGRSSTSSNTNAKTTSNPNVSETDRS
jgi:general stress protein YciG